MNAKPTVLMAILQALIFSIIAIGTFETTHVSWFASCVIAFAFLSVLSWLVRMVLRR